jgi:hypothetical protein
MKKASDKAPEAVACNFLPTGSSLSRSSGEAGVKLWIGQNSIPDWEEASAVGLVGVLGRIGWGPMPPVGCGAYGGGGRRVMLG